MCKISVLGEKGQILNWNLSFHALRRGKDGGKSKQKSMKEEQRTQIMESSPNGRKHRIETIYDTSLRFIPHSLLAPEGQKNCLSPNRTSLSLPSTKILLSSVASHAHPSKNEHRVLQKFTTTTQHKAFQSLFQRQPTWPKPRRRPHPRRPPPR